MSLRIGGIAAIVGAPIWTLGFLIANDVVLSGNTRAAAILVVAGSLALLVALAALSAFHARVRPLLSWAAFALPAIAIELVLTIIVLVLFALTATVAVIAVGAPLAETGQPMRPVTINDGLARRDRLSPACACAAGS